MHALDNNGFSEKWYQNFAFWVIMLMQIVPMITRMLMAIMLYSRKRRHMQGDAKVAMHPQISIITCHFVL